MIGKQHLGKSVFRINVFDKKRLHLLKSWDISNAEIFIAIDEHRKNVFWVDYDFNIHKLDFSNNNNNNIVLKNMLLLGSWDFKGKIQIDDRQNEQICIFDTNTNKVVEVYPKYKGSSPIFLRNYVVYHLYSSKEIVIKNKENTFYATFSLSVLSNFGVYWQSCEVWHFVGVVEGILWVDISSSYVENNRSKGALLGIEVATGTLKYFLDIPSIQNQEPLNEFWYLPQFPHTVYDTQTHKLVGLFGKRYWEVDLSASTPQLAMRALDTEFGAKNITLHNSDRRTMDTNYIYFADSHEPKIGVLNRKTFTLDWVYNFGADFSATLVKIEVSENHLFVLDSKGTLHIFERES